MLRTSTLLLSIISLFSQCAQKAVTQSSSAQDAIKEIPDPTQPDPEALYANLCSSCHGARMEMFVDRRWVNGNKAEDIHKSIAKGITSSGMPAYEGALSEEEISALTAYIMDGVNDRATYNIQSDKTPKYYKTQHYALQVDTVVNNLEIPWGLKVQEDGTVYFTEREGKLKIYNPSDKSLIDVQGLPAVRNRVQGGMLDVVLHPDFGENGWIYLSYSKYRMDGMKKVSTTAVVRGRVRDGKWMDQEEIFEALPYLDSKYHYGSRMVFDNDGYLFITVGDRGRRDEHPQFLTNSCGKVHRVMDDGRIPEDNPFFNQESAIKSIWSYGHRNAQGLVYDPITDQLWEHEHGPRGGDELNLVQKAQNYGWPIISYGINYNGTVFTKLTEKPGMLQPLKTWIPSIGPSGMAWVTGSKFPEWSGNILSGSLRFNYISRVKVSDGELVEDERILQDIGRVRCIEMGEDGNIYIGVENPGRILKLSIRKQK